MLSFWGGVASLLEERFVPEGSVPRGLSSSSWHLELMKLKITTPGPAVDADIPRKGCQLYPKTSTNYNSDTEIASLRLDLGSLDAPMQQARLISILSLAHFIVSSFTKIQELNSIP